MSESTAIIKAVTTQWNASSALQTMPLRSTRIPAGEAVVFPYGLVQTRVIRHLQCSGKYQLTCYLVSLLVYCGRSKAVVDSVSASITSLFSMNIGLPVADNCHVIQALPVIEDPNLDQDDYYGEDCNVLSQQFQVLLCETRPEVNSTLAT